MDIQWFSHARTVYCACKIIGTFETLSLLTAIYDSTAGRASTSELLELNFINLEILQKSINMHMHGKDGDHAQNKPTKSSPMPATTLSTAENLNANQVTSEMNWVTLTVS